MNHNSNRFIILIIAALAVIGILLIVSRKRTGHTAQTQAALRPAQASPASEAIARQPMQDDVSFWSRQMSEHALFLKLGLEDAQLKQQADQLHQQWEKFRASSDKNKEQLLTLLKELKTYKAAVLKTLNSGKWIGWIFPDLVEHMLLELNYFTDKVNGVKYSVADELKFWNKEHEGQALTTAHLLDPSEKELVKKAMEIAAHFEEKKPVESTEETWLQLSLRASKELDAFDKEGQKKSKANQVKSIIHPLLLDHETREAERSVQILEGFEKK